MNETDFSNLVDQTGMKLTADQKRVLLQVYPMFQAMVARATPPMPRENEPSVMFSPEVK